MRHTLSLTALAALLAGCPMDYSLTGEVTTSGGHIVDGRSWAVGTEIRLSSTAADGMVRLEGAEGVLEEAPAFRYGMPVSSGQVSARIVGEGDFDVVVTAPGGGERSRTTLRAEEPSSWALGLVLDDCPEFPDVLLNEEGTESRFVDASTTMVALAPVGADGGQLLGHFDYEVEGLGVTDGWGLGDFGDVPAMETHVTLPLTTFEATGADELVFTAFGQEHRFPVSVVAVEDIAAARIVGQAEKHGIDGELLLTVLGMNKSGGPIAGAEATWSNGYVGSYAHAADGSEVEACIGDACTSWSR